MRRITTKSLKSVHVLWQLYLKECFDDALRGTSLHRPLKRDLAIIKTHNVYILTMYQRVCSPFHMSINLTLTLAWDMGVIIIRVILKINKLRCKQIK